MKKIIIAIVAVVMVGTAGFFGVKYAENYMEEARAASYAEGYQTACDDVSESVYNEGVAYGYTKGYEDAYDDATVSAYHQGYEDGTNTGYYDGYQDCTEETKKDHWVINKLFTNKREETNSEINGEVLVDNRD